MVHAYMIAILILASVLILNDSSFHSVLVNLLDKQLKIWCFVYFFLIDSLLFSLYSAELYVSLLMYLIACVIVSSKEEVGSADSLCVDPVDLNSFFDEDGKIYGYQGLQVI